MGLTKQTARKIPRNNDFWREKHRHDWQKAMKSKGKKRDKSKDQEESTKELRTETPTSNQDAKINKEDALTGLNKRFTQMGLRLNAFPKGSKEAEMREKGIYAEEVANSVQAMREDVKWYMEAKEDGPYLFVYKQTVRKAFFPF